MMITNADSANFFITTEALCKNKVVSKPGASIRLRAISTKAYYYYGFWGDFFHGYGRPAGSGGNSERFGDG